MKNWLSLFLDGSPLRAIPREPAPNGTLLYSDGMTPPPEPVPWGSPPCITQSSTLWKVRLLKCPDWALLAKLSIVPSTFADGSVKRRTTMRPFDVSITILPSPRLAAGVAGSAGTDVGLVASPAVVGVATGTTGTVVGTMTAVGWVVAV